MFCKGNVESISHIKEKIRKFSSASSLEVNEEKSAVYFGGLSEVEQGNLAELLYMPIGVLPFKYLEVPLSYKKLFINQCMPLVDRIAGRVKHWSCRALSFVVRLTLVKSVLVGVKIH